MVLDDRDECDNYCYTDTELTMAATRKKPATPTLPIPPARRHLSPIKSVDVEMAPATSTRYIV